MISDCVVNRIKHRNKALLHWSGGFGDIRQAKIPFFTETESQS
jgi:hypothetical protein